MPKREIVISSNKKIRYRSIVFFRYGRRENGGDRYRGVDMDLRGIDL